MYVAVAGDTWGPPPLTIGPTRKRPPRSSDDVGQHPTEQTSGDQVELAANPEEGEGEQDGGDDIENQVDGHRDSFRLGAVDRDFTKRHNLLSKRGELFDQLFPGGTPIQLGFQQVDLVVAPVKLAGQFVDTGVQRADPAG